MTMYVVKQRRTGLTSFNSLSLRHEDSIVSFGKIYGGQVAAHFGQIYTDAEIMRKVDY